MEIEEAPVGRVAVRWAAVLGHLAARVVNTSHSSEGCLLWRTLEYLVDVEVEDSEVQKAVALVAVVPSETQALGAVVQTSGLEDFEGQEGRPAY